MGQTEIKRCGPPEATREAGANGAGATANARGSGDSGQERQLRQLGGAAAAATTRGAGGISGREIRKKLFLLKCKLGFS